MCIIYSIALYMYTTIQGVYNHNIYQLDKAKCNLRLLSLLALLLSHCLPFPQEPWSCELCSPFALPSSWPLTAHTLADNAPRPAWEGGLSTLASTVYDTHTINYNDYMCMSIHNGTCPLRFCFTPSVLWDWAWLHCQSEWFPWRPAPLCSAVLWFLL